MTKAVKIFSLALVLLLACATVLTACDDGQTPSNDGGNPPAHTHTFGEWETITAATCIAAGEQKRVCSCGETETEAIAATGEHDYDSGEVTTAPGCTTEGVMTYTCSVCDRSYTEAIPAAGHQYEIINFGGLADTCSVCGAARQE